MSINQYRNSRYGIDPVFLNRWSPRAFKEADLPEEDLLAVLEAASWAPSASNIQPWRFITATSKEEKEHFFSFIMDGNLLWCKKAPALILIISKTSTETGPNVTHAFDTGTAWGYLALEATKRGLITHAMGGFDREAARKELGVPDEYDIHAVIAIGYPGDKQELPQGYQDREKPSSRRALQETVYKRKFGESYPL